MAKEHIILSTDQRELLGKLAHVAEFFAGERTRLQAELAYVMQRGSAAHNELCGHLMRTFGVDAQHSDFELDTARGVLTIDHAEPDPTPDPASSEPVAEAEPQPAKPVRKSRAPRARAAAAKTANKG